MPLQTFLFVNADKDSYPSSKRHPQERGPINRHVQSSWIERRRQEKQQACSTAKAVLRWKAPTTRVVASKSLRPPASRPKSCSNWSFRLDSGTNNAPRFPSHHAARSKYPLFRLCGKDDAVDPFASTAIKIDSNVQDLLLFYISASRTSSTELLHTIQQHLSSESQSYPLLAFAAAWMENLKAGNFVKRRGLVYQQKALEQTQSLLQNKDTSSNDMLWNIANMSFTTIYQKQDQGTIAHLQAADYLISQVNDFEALDPIATVQIMSSDHHQAHSTLTPLVLKIDQHFAPYTRKSLSDPKLAEIAGSLLLEGNQLPPNLIRCLEDIFQLATVVESSWVNQAHSLQRDLQLLLDIKRTTPRLLPHLFDEESDPIRCRELAALRLALVLWSELLVACVFGRDNLRTTCPGIRPEVLESRKSFWVPQIYDSLRRWNEIVSSIPWKYDVRCPFFFRQLFHLVRDMEVHCDIQLATFMERVVELDEELRGHSTYFDDSCSAQEFRARMLRTQQN